jgi:hypothetical protein
MKETCKRAKRLMSQLSNERDQLKSSNFLNDRNISLTADRRNGSQPLAKWISTIPEKI